MLFEECEAVLYGLFVVSFCSGVDEESGDLCREEESCGIVGSESLGDALIENLRSGVGGSLVAQYGGLGDDASSLGSRVGRVARGNSFSIANFR
jgi:hypothetical protein